MGHVNSTDIKQTSGAAKTSYLLIFVFFSKVLISVRIIKLYKKKLSICSYLNVIYINSALKYVFSFTTSNLG